jgi:hypothetical protein
LFETFTQIISVKFSSRELSFAVANRAAVFLEIGGHQRECLEGKTNQSIHLMSMNLESLNNWVHFNRNIISYGNQ